MKEGEQGEKKEYDRPAYRYPLFFPVFGNLKGNMQIHYYEWWDFLRIIQPECSVIYK